jgi:crotonobetaine/carnitine-CoA ligase
MTIRDVIEQAAQKGNNNTYLFWEDQEISFAEFDATVNRVANGLRSLGVNKGDKICLLMHNCPEFLYSWFGANKIGAVMVPVNTAFKNEETKYIVTHSEAKVLITQPSFTEMVRAIRGDCKHLQTVICMGEQSNSGVVPYAQLLEGAPVLGPVELDEEDIAAYVYTSGTTGFPKGAMLPHRSYVCTGEGFAFWFKLTQEDRIINHNPLFHANAQCYATMGSLVAGVPMILMEKFSVSKFWDEARRYRATVSTALAAPLLIKNPPSDRDTDHPIRVFFNILSPEFRKRFNVKVITGFSMTETMVGCLCNIPEVEEQRGSWNYAGVIGLGAPHPDPKKNTEAKVVDENDNETPVGQIGELAIRGPAVMKGYFKNPQETAKALRDGWMHTGDAAFKRDDGLIYFFGRKKDIIRVSGENVSPAEIENVINTNPKVMESACLGVPSPIRGEEIKAYVVLKSGESLDQQEIVDWCRTRLAYFKVPRYVEYRTGLPKTAATNRVQKHVLKAEKADLTEGCYDRGEKPAWYHS